MELDGSPSATALLGLDGFEVLAQVEEDGEWWLLVETVEPWGWCPECGVRTVIHDRASVPVRDREIAGRPVVVVWNKRVFRCPAAECPKRTWRERHEAIRPRVSLDSSSRVVDRTGPRGDVPAGR